MKRAVSVATAWFGHHQHLVDAINVFPVPDGDTGKNMHSALHAAQKALHAHASRHAGEMAQRMAHAALLGGRGCSGMILSGFFSGFSESLRPAQKNTPAVLAQGLMQAAELARTRVPEPMPGTILSVGQTAGHEAWAAARSGANVLEVLEAAWRGAKRALAETTAQMKILQENQAVDAGGLGLVFFFEGIVRFARGESLDPSQNPSELLDMSSAVSKHDPERSLPYRYCFECVLQNTLLPPEKVNQTLLQGNDSVMVVATGNGDLKIHLHTNTPHPIHDYLAGLGKMEWSKTDDMLQQHHHRFAGAGD
jgi:hypothetical protein